MASNGPEKDQSKEIKSILHYYTWEQSKNNSLEKKETSNKEIKLHAISKEFIENWKLKIKYDDLKKEIAKMEKEKKEEKIENIISEYYKKEIKDLDLKSFGEIKNISLLKNLDENKKDEKTYINPVLNEDKMELINKEVFEVFESFKELKMDITIIVDCKLKDGKYIMKNNEDKNINEEGQNVKGKEEINKEEIKDKDKEGNNENKKERELDKNKKIDTQQTYIKKENEKEQIKEENEKQKEEEKKDLEKKEEKKEKIKQEEKENLVRENKEENKELEKEEKKEANTNQLKENKTDDNKGKEEDDKNKENKEETKGDKGNENKEGKKEEKKDELNEEKDDEKKKKEDKNEEEKKDGPKEEKKDGQKEDGKVGPEEKKKKDRKEEKKYEQKKGKNCLTKQNICLYILNICGIICYKWSLMSCAKDPTECTVQRGMKFYITIGVLALISSLSLSIYVTITINYNKYFFHYIYTIPAYIYFIVKYRGTDTADHGFYNGGGWIIFNIILIPLLLFCFRICYLIKNKRYKNLMMIIIIIFGCIIYYNNLTGFSCDFWDLGLNNTRIENDKSKYACKILLPEKNKCYLKKMNGFFDFSKIFRPSCTAENILDKEKQIFLNSLSDKYFGISKLNHFGYPITTIPDKFTMSNENNIKELSDFQELINHNIIKMDLYNKDNYPDFPYPEVELFFDENNHGKIKINLTKNETLSDERVEISKKKNSLFNNVLIVYIDAFSRNLFLRKMHKLAKFIEQYMPYNLNEKEKPYTSFQFLKYNTLRDLTYPNIKAMFYGIDVEEDYGINALKYYKKQGYVTGHTGTTCGREIFSVNNALSFGKYLDYDVWDHENIALFCDPNFFNSHYTLNKGVASYIKRCLYGKYAFEYMIEYGKQFWNAYPENKKFFRIHFNEGHEGTMELVTYLADPLFEFVRYFFENNLLNDTFIFVVSDHGNHIVGPWTFLRPQDYVLESTLATLCFIVPNSKKIYQNGLYDIVHENQQVFITPYDIYNTMVHIALGDDKVDNNSFSKRGSSILSYINPMERYCENPVFNLKIKEIYCKCKKY